MRFYYRRGGKGAAPEGFDRVYTEVDGDGNVLRELLAYVRADDSVTVEMDGELGGTAGAFVEMALALYRQQATLLCKSPKIDTAAGHWQAVLSDLALLTSRDTGDAARLSRFMEGLHRCFDLVERRQMTVAEVCRKMSIGKTTYYRYWRMRVNNPVRIAQPVRFDQTNSQVVRHICPLCHGQCCDNVTAHKPVQKRELLQFVEVVKPFKVAGGRIGPQ